MLFKREISVGLQSGFPVTVIFTPTGLDLVHSRTSSGTKTTFSPGTVCNRSEPGAGDHRRDPSLSNRTISLWLMPTRVRWRPGSLSSLLLIHLHNPCDTPINNSSPICISMPEIEDRHLRRYTNTVQPETNCQIWFLWDEGSPGRRVITEYF